MGWLKKISQNVIARNLILAVSAVLIFVAVSAVALNVFTRHNRYKQVPDFVGAQLSDVKRMAGREDLRIEILDSIYAPVYDGGTVLEQQPVAGAEVKSGRRIFVTVASYRQKMVEVPYVTGYSLRQAKNMLEMAGLEIAEIRYVDNIATNNILAMLSGRDTVRRNSNLRLEIGSGVTLVAGRSEFAAPVEVPKIVGLSLGEAKSRLWERGLNVGKVKTDDGINPLNRKDARVYNQLPSYGHMAGLGDKVGFSLTLDEKKTDDGSNAADRDARRIINQRQQETE